MVSVPLGLNGYATATPIVVYFNLLISYTPHLRAGIFPLVFYKKQTENISVLRPQVLGVPKGNRTPNFPLGGECYIRLTMGTKVAQIDLSAKTYEPPYPFTPPKLPYITCLHLLNVASVRTSHGSQQNIA